MIPYWKIVWILIYYSIFNKYWIDNNTEYPEEMLFNIIIADFETSFNRNILH